MHTPFLNPSGVCIRYASETRAVENAVGGSSSQFLGAQHPIVCGVVVRRLRYKKAPMPFCECHSHNCELKISVYYLVNGQSEDVCIVAIVIFGKHVLANLRMKAPLF